MGLEIELEYDDTQDGVWSPAGPADESPLRDRLSRLRGSGPRVDNPLIVHLGIALTALAVGAASIAGFLAGRTAANNRTVTLLHLAPVNPFVVQPLPTPPAATTNQDIEQLLATPWTNTFDQAISLSVVNDGPDPITVLGGTLSSMDFQTATLTPASTAPTAPGGVSVLRGRAHFVCGDYPLERVATVANLRARTADGVTRQEKLVVDHFSDIAEGAVCAQMPAPEVIRSKTFSPSPNTSNAYTAVITATNRAPFPLRMSLPQSAVQSWTSGGGLFLAASGDTVIPPHGTGAIRISVTITDCPTAQEASVDGFIYDTLAFSDARDSVTSPQTRMIDQQLLIEDPTAIMTYCLSKIETPGGGG